MSRPVSYFYLCCLFFFLSQPSVVLSIPASGHIASAYNASISTLERRFEQDAIICAPGPIPTEAWPASLGRSPKEYQTLWDVCSAYGNTGANAGCLCEQPGLNYDVDCYKNLAHPALYGQGEEEGGFFILCQLRCRCLKHVPGIPLRNTFIALQPLVSKPRRKGPARGRPPLLPKTPRNGPPPGRRFNSAALTRAAGVAYFQSSAFGLGK